MVVELGEKKIKRQKNANFPKFPWGNRKLRKTPKNTLRTKKLNLFPNSM
jgi:hypothetical protein